MFYKRVSTKRLKMLRQAKVSLVAGLAYAAIVNLTTTSLESAAASSV